MDHNERNKALNNALQALQNGKLRLIWENRPPEEISSVLLLPELWTLLRKKHTDPPGISQDETVFLRLAEIRENTFVVHCRILFDRDFCSQYDKTEEWNEVLIVEKQ